MVMSMATRKVTITLSEEALADVRRYAKAEGLSVSAWLERAARDRGRQVRLANLAEYVRQNPDTEWEEFLERDRWSD